MDPRGLKKEDWEWAELNAFHSSDVARQLLEDIDKAISDAIYLRKKQRGEVDKDLFKTFWKGDNGQKSVAEVKDSQA